MLMTVISVGEVHVHNGAKREGGHRKHRLYAFCSSDEVACRMQLYRATYRVLFGVWMGCRYRRLSTSTAAPHSKMIIQISIKSPQTMLKMTGKI